jgi:hypothetical protein
MMMLLESLAGHLALLGEVHPKKAATSVARRARVFLRISGVETMRATPKRRALAA